MLFVLTCLVGLVGILYTTVSTSLAAALRLCVLIPWTATVAMLVIGGSNSWMGVVPVALVLVLVLSPVLVLAPVVLC